MSFEAEQADRGERRRIDMREIGRREGGEVRMNGAIWEEGEERTIWGGSQTMR